MRICVLGLGYIGLPTAAILATRGFSVHGCDVRREVAERLLNGSLHIEEPGLATVFQAAMQSGRLHVGMEPAEADAYIIAVPTPLKEEESEGALPYRRADLSNVAKAAEAIVPLLRRDCLVILESTSPPGTTRDFVAPILERSGLRAGEDFHLVYSPERVLPGAILKEIIANNRIVGGINAESSRRARDLYAEFVEGEIFETDCVTAEMVKLAENTFRDVNIALANELSRLCGKVGSNVWEVLRLANHHPRVNLHQPGPGVGGHCIAVDPWFLVEASPEDTPLIRTAREVNDGQPVYTIRAIESLVAAHGPGAIAFFGVTYKANVDDVRESPCRAIIEHFQGAGHECLIHDPHVRDYPHPLIGSADEAAARARYFVFLVDHREFQALPAQAFEEKVILDTRNLLRGRRLPDSAALYLLGSAAEEPKTVLP